MQMQVTLPSEPAYTVHHERTASVVAIILVTITTTLGHAKPECFTSVLLEINKQGSPCTSWARKPWGHGNPWEIFVLGMRAFGLQGVRGREEHIIFNGKQAAKEIRREVASSSLLHTPDASLLVIKKGSRSPLFLLVLD